MLVAQVEQAERPLEFSSVYDEHVDFVWSMTRRLGVSSSQLEDAVQDVFVVVHRQLPGFRAESSLKTWVGGIVVRVAQEHRRKQKRNEVEPLTGDNVPVATGGPHETAEGAQAWARLERLLDTLELEQRTVFVLASLEEMSAPDIAEVLQVPLNTVYSRLRLARAKLQEALSAFRPGEL